MTDPTPLNLTLRSAGSSTAVLLPERGGLLTQLTLRDEGGKSAQVLWLPESFSAAESGWPGGGMPLLFPFAGRQFHHGTPLHYALGGRSYHMPLHGFAYALAWSVSRHSDTSAELVLRSGEATAVPDCAASTGSPTSCALTPAGGCRLARIPSISCCWR